MNKYPYMRRLPLSGTQNTRDLGGYVCCGGVTRWGSFLRSDNPAGLSPGDIQLLLEYGISTVVDLRGKSEALQDPSSLFENPAFNTQQISANDQMHIINFEGDTEGSMAGLYIALLDESMGAMANIMRAIAAAPGGVLFHCAVGKDRTGVLAMLLLKLAGVCDADVIADYAVTEIYKREVFAAQAKVFAAQNVPEYVLRSRPVSMQRVLRHLEESYGSAESYLLAAGLSPGEIATIKERLVQPAQGMPC